MRGKLTARPLGRTGLQVSPLGLASVSLTAGVSRRGNATMDAAAVERAFHEHGINTFLVHYLMRGICAGVRRLIRAGYRDDLVLVSEVGLPFAGSVRRGLELHLRRLGIDHLDVWLLGWVRSRWYVRDTVWTELSRLRQAGAARCIGVSSHDRLLAARLAADLEPDVLMLRYNAAHRGAEREVFPLLEGLPGGRPGVIAFTATRWRMLMQPLPDHGFPRAMSAPECYRFVLGHPAVDTVWCAAATEDELREDVAGVLLGPLDPQRLQQVRRFGDAVHAAAAGGRRWLFGPTAD